ncbi:MAG: N-acetylmuramoyl-L-alanine amidase [Clostridium sp.]|nr:N-acetylmuramoyl-L-alanine amidase [Clostridium sp.]
MKKVCLDFGHGGTDSGAIGINNVKEKDYTLALGERIVELLRNYGVKIITTRNKDNYVSLNDRVEIANNNNVDLFISIHCNAHSNDSANGFETYSYKGNTDLQKVTHNNIMLTIPQLKNRGMKKASYYVLKYTKANALLIECGFITNKSDYNILINNIENFALSITKSIVTYIGLKPIENRELYRVVVGSYIDRNNAQNMVNQLEKDGYKPFITKATI